MSDPAARTLDLLLEPYLAAIHQFDVMAAEKSLHNAATFLDPRTFALDFALVALREIGDGRHGGSVRMAQERIVVSQIRSALLSPRWNPQTHLGRRLLVATSPRQLHEIGLLAGALLAKLRGMTVIYLGVDLPEEEIAWAAREVEVDAVLMAALHEHPPPRLEVFDGAPYAVWFGGPGAPRGAPENVISMTSFDALDQALLALTPRRCPHSV